jgi:RNA polymerase-binding transcription factor DksA
LGTGGRGSGGDDKNRFITDYVVDNERGIVYARKAMTKFSIPANLLKPIREFLENEAVKLKRKEKAMVKNDPFGDEDRLRENSTEEDVDEQLGHFDNQVKSKFINRQLVQVRKALTRLKLGKYGICEKCGKMIDTERLAVRPEATICISCEKEDEI